MTSRFGFPKSEKLCGKIRIKTLYDNGKHFTCYPLRVTWLAQKDDTDGNVAVLIWAPKSLFKHAVDRNRLRRLMREAYRLNAQALRDKYAQSNTSLQLAFNYIAKEELTFAEIEKAMKKAIKKLMTNENADS